MTQALPGVFRATIVNQCVFQAGMPGEGVRWKLGQKPVSACLCDDGNFFGAAMANSPMPSIIPDPSIEIGSNGGHLGNLL